MPHDRMGDMMDGMMGWGWLGARADERCPGVYCMTNPIALATDLATS